MPIMRPMTDGDRRLQLGEHTYVSVGLVSALVVGALFYGRQLQRLDVIERDLHELQGEVRTLLQRQPGR